MMVIIRMDSLRATVGAILWWAEGTKSRRDKRWKNAISYPVEITSTDPLAIKLFLEFLRKDLQIDERRLRVQLHIHENDDQKAFEKYWSEICQVPLKHFHKTIVRPAGKKLGKTKGTCKIRYHDKRAYLDAKKVLENIVRKIPISSGCSAVG